MADPRQVRHDPRQLIQMVRQQISAIRTNAEKTKQDGDIYFIVQGFPVFRLEFGEEELTQVEMLGTDFNFSEQVECKNHNVASILICSIAERITEKTAALNQIAGLLYWFKEKLEQPKKELDKPPIEELNDLLGKVISEVKTTTERVENVCGDVVDFPNKPAGPEIEK